MIDELSQTGYVCQTIIPELDKFKQENRMGMIPSSIIVAVANYGWILFLAYDAKSNTSTLYKARLHSPVDKLISLKKGTKAKEVHYAHGIAFLACESGPLKAVEVLPNSITISLKGKRKADLEEIANQLKLSSLGIMTEIRSRIEGHLKRTELKYDGLLTSKEDIVFPKSNKKPLFEAMVCVDNKLLYATKKSVGDQREVVQLILQSDGVRLECIEEHVILSCDEDWGKVQSMCINGNCLFLSNQRGISKMDLTTTQHSLILAAPNDPRKLTKFGPDLLFTNQKSCSVWKLRSTGEADVFAGKEEGSLDGPKTTSCFKQPMGIATEFDSVVYLCDAQTNSIKLLSKMNHCAKFLRAIGAIYEAFSVHSKGALYEKKTAEEVIDLVRHCKTVLEEHAFQIRAKSKITGALNGPQGRVSAKTVNSVQLMEWGLGRLAGILGEYGYQALDLLSCMTLDVENCHVTVHSKKVNMSKLEYARSFGATMKESVKRATSWAAYYHTSRRSWYPKPDTTVSLHNVRLMMPLSVVNLPASDCDLLRNWASAYGAAVRQRTVRQETTMAKHGTLPEFLYQRHLEVGDKVNLDFEVGEDEDLNVWIKA